jgi:hypothetical protein
VRFVLKDNRLVGKDRPDKTGTRLSRAGALGSDGKGSRLENGHETLISDGGRRLTLAGFAEEVSGRRLSSEPY